MGRKKHTKEELMEEFKYMGIDDILFDGVTKPCIVLFSNGRARDWKTGRKALEYLRRHNVTIEERAREKIFFQRANDAIKFNLKDIITKYGNEIELRQFAYDNKLSFVSASSILDTFRYEGLLKIEYELIDKVYRVKYRASEKVLFIL